MPIDWGLYKYCFQIEIFPPGVQRQAHRLKMLTKFTGLRKLMEFTGLRKFMELTGLR